MPDSESALLIPLRTNASALLTGGPLAAVRRRLKLASLFYDRVHLEAGVFRMQVGSGGKFDVVEYPDPSLPRWQTPQQRHTAQAAPFTVSMGREQTPGVPAATITPVLSSPSTVSWAATLYPFARELPAGTDWIEFTGTKNPTGNAERLARQWAHEDERNAALGRAVPERFVRNAVIANANRDLVIAAAEGVAVSIDPLHAQVAAQRFRDGDAWKLTGYAVPILFPHVGDLPWETIADLRRDRAMARFRAVLREVEQEAAAEAVNGDIEAAAQHAYRRYLAGYPETLPSVGDVAHRNLTGFVIGGVTGFAVCGITGPLGILASSALGSAVSTILDVRDFIQRRKSRGWIALDHRIEALRQ